MEEHFLEYIVLSAYVLVQCDTQMSHCAKCSDKLSHSTREINYANIPAKLCYYKQLNYYLY